jgi:hypothetical protein
MTQDENILTCTQTAKKFDIENVYLNNWPIREALKSRLKYTADFEKKKEMRKAQAELKEVRQTCP